MMIIKFKIFENIEQISRFWILPTDERFIPSLDKINCPKNAQKELREDREIVLLDDPNKKYIIIYFSSIEDMNPWRSAEYIPINMKSFLGLGSEYQFGGYINIEDYELDAEKYNL